MSQKLFKIQIKNALWNLIFPKGSVDDADRISHCRLVTSGIRICIKVYIFPFRSDPCLSLFDRLNSINFIKKWIIAVNFLACNGSGWWGSVYIVSYSRAMKSSNSVKVWCDLHLLHLCVLSRLLFILFINWSLWK